MLLARSLQLLQVVLLLLLVGGCSWFGGKDKDDKKDEALLKPAPMPKFDAEVDIRQQWGVSVGKGLGRKYIRLSPAILADRIYAADAYGRLEAFDRFKGKRQWRVQMKAQSGGFFSHFDVLDRTDPSFVTGGVSAGDGKVFLGTTSGEVVAFSAVDGSEVWRSFVGSEVLAPVAFGEGLVFAQTIDGGLVAVKSDTGESVWRFDSQVPILTLRGTATPVYDDGVVYAGFANGTVNALRAQNGEPLWEDRVMLPEGRSELDRMVDVDATPLVRGGVLYAVAYQGNLQALRRTEGTPLWEMEMSSFLDMDEGYGQLYVVDEDDVITAIDESTAEVVWKQEGLRHRQLSPPTVFSNYVAVADHDGYLFILAQSDGRFLGRRKLDGKGVRSRMIYQDGTLYAYGNSGSLKALEIQVR